MTCKQGELYRIPQREATANHLYGAVDLGSNTFRLLIGRIENGQIIPLLKKMHTVRLGADLHRTGEISKQAGKRAVAALTEFRELLDLHQPHAVRVCGTAALRTATNRQQFLNEAATILGIKAEVIDGEQEAFLSSAGAFTAMHKQSTGTMLLADIGGGSSELITATATTIDGLKINSTISLPLGAVNLSETYLHAAIPVKNELLAMSKRVETIIIPTVATMATPPPTVIGIGGTATALAALDCNLNTYDSHRIQDHQLSMAKLTRILAKLSHLSGSDRNQLPGLGQGRGEIIIGGLIILITLLKVLSAPALTVSDGGLLEGILLSAINHNH